MLKHTKGCLLSLAEDGKFDIIVHGCNCFCTMGAGIAKTIKHKYPEAYQADCNTKKGDINKLGTYSYHNTGKFIIININGVELKTFLNIIILIIFSIH